MIAIITENLNSYTTSIKKKNSNHTYMLMANHGFKFKWEIQLLGKKVKGCHM